MISRRGLFCALLVAPLLALRRREVGFANGTSGRWRDFGKGTALMLHGRERWIYVDEFYAHKDRRVVDALRAVK